MPVLGGAIFQMAAKSFFPNTVGSLRSTTKVEGRLSVHRRTRSCCWWT